MDFTSQYFPGYTRPSTARARTQRRTSARRVTFRSPSPSPERRRTSKKRSPRSQVVYNVSKGFRRLSPRKIQNKYARDVAEFVQALSPAIIAALSIYLYTVYENKPRQEPTDNV